jgi:hypothetical protein
MLQKTMVFCMQVLATQGLPPRQKDGILHIVGSVAKILMKKSMYKDQVEMMLVTYVFPEFQSPDGFLRARVSYLIIISMVLIDSFFFEKACWVLKSFSKINFKSPDNLMNACNYIKHCILNDQSLPVNVEACIALQDMLTEDEIEINLTGNHTLVRFIQFIILC